METSAASLLRGDGDPSHTDGCYACGSANPSGLKMRRWFEGTVAYGELMLTAEHQGYPGYAHGGVVAAGFDEVLGTVPQLWGILAVTGSLEVRFERPCVLDRRYVMRAELEHFERPRKLHLVGEMTDADGQPHASARGLWISVEGDHFAAADAWSQRDGSSRQS